MQRRAVGKHTGKHTGWDRSHFRSALKQSSESLYRCAAWTCAPPVSQLAFPAPVRWEQRALRLGYVNLSHNGKEGARLMCNRMFNTFTHWKAADLEFFFYFMWRRSPQPVKDAFRDSGGRLCRVLPLPFTCKTSRQKPLSQLNGQSFSLFC